MVSSISSEVGIVSNKFLSTAILTDYVYEEKFDGDKITLIVYKNSIYECTKKYFKQVYTDDTNWPLSIVDCEKVLINGVNNALYIIFDCLIYNNKWLNDYDYITRLKHCKAFVNEYKDVINCYRPKCYALNATKWSKLLMLTENLKQSNELEHVNIDGLVLHKINTPFINGELYKLKNSGLMTTDFLLKWIDEKQLYYVYSIGFPNEVLSLIHTVINTLGIHSSIVRNRRIYYLTTLIYSTHTNSNQINTGWKRITKTTNIIRLSKSTI